MSSNYIWKNYPTTLWPGFGLEYNDSGHDVQDRKKEIVEKSKKAQNKLNFRIQY